MATDARISTELPGHPKTKKLIRRLGPAGGWSLLCLILWTRANRPNGSLEGMTVEDIELAADWTGECDAFARELLAVGFLEGSDGAYCLHDWAEHQPWAAGAEARSEKSRWAALCKQHGRQEAARLMPEYAARIGVASEPGATGVPVAPQSLPLAAGGTPLAQSGMPLADSGSAPSPSPSPSPSPNTPLTPQGGKSARTPPRTPEEETEDLAMFHHQFWPAYPNKADKQAAYRAWRKLRVNPELLARILAGLELWKQHPKWVKDGGQFRHNPATWLNRRLWEDEEVCGGMRAATAEKVPEWCQKAGFECVEEAHNRMCWEHNAHLFREGKRIPAEAGA